MKKKITLITKQKRENWKEGWKVLVLDILLKSKPKTRRYPLGQLEVRGIEFIRTLLSRRTRLAREERKRIVKEIETMKLPYPNPYGKWVRVPRVNDILTEVAKKVRGEQ